MTEADVTRIKSELEQISGVRTVEIHEPTHSVTVVWTEPAGMDDIWKRLEWLHFTPDFPQTD
jgi:hypothetical protein